MTASLPEDKLVKAIASTSQALSQDSLSYQEAKSLAGFLTFCAKAVRLGHIFMCPLWNFSASFPMNCSPYLRKKLNSELKEDLL